MQFVNVDGSLAAHHGQFERHICECGKPWTRNLAQMFVIGEDNSLNLLDVFALILGSSDLDNIPQHVKDKSHPSYYFCSSKYSW